MRSKTFVFRILHSAIRFRQIRHSASRIPHLMRYLSLGQQLILFFLALFLLVILYFRFYHHPPPSTQEESGIEFVVEVAGEVRSPGIYIFKNPPTLKEAIEKAGGFKEPAQFDKGSSSEALETGTLLNVGKEESDGGKKQEVIKVKLGRMEARKLFVFSIPLDLNRVSMEDLCLIPGIGESLAREIVTYRKRRKGFRSIEELKNVKGIGEKKYQSFKLYLVVIP